MRFRTVLPRAETDRLPNTKAIISKMTEEVNFTEHSWTSLQHLFTSPHILRHLQRTSNIFPSKAVIQEAKKKIKKDNKSLTLHNYIVEGLFYNKVTR